MGTSSGRSRRRRPSAQPADSEAKSNRVPLMLNGPEAAAAAALAGFVVLFVAVALLASGETGDGGASADDAATITSDDAAATSDPGTTSEADLPTAAATEDDQPTAGDEEEILKLARRSIEVLPTGQWPSLYDSFTSEFQQRCPREEFDQAGVDAAAQLGDDLRLLRFKRLESVTIEGPSAKAVITGEIAGQGEYQIQAAFQKGDGGWKIAPAPDTEGCQAFLSD